MKCSNCERCPMALALRWTGRALGVTIFAFVAWFLMAHIIAGMGPNPSADGPPNPFKMNAIELGMSVGLFGAVAGMLIGWRWEAFGGMMVVAGMSLFFVIERFAGGSWPRGWLLWSFPLPGILYLLASCFEACRARHLKVTT
jgi:hypothetical protein